MDKFKKNDNDELSIIIPVYNENKSIINTLNTILNIFKRLKLRYEIIIVNDGSTDNTLEFLKKFEAEPNNDTIHIISHKVNKGYGASIKTGVIHSKFNNICITDADSTYPVETIPKLFQLYIKNNLDMIIGKRKLKELPTMTKPVKWFLTKFAGFLVGQKIMDINSGLRIFKKDIMLKYIHLISDGFSFTTTITLSMISNNYTIDYFDIDYRKREGKSKIRPIYDTFNFLQLIIRIILYFNPLKIFIPLSLFMFLLALLTFFIGYFYFGNLYDSTITTLFIGGILVAAIGMLADLIDKKIIK